MSSKDKEKKRAPRPDEGRPTKYKPEYCKMLVDYMEKINTFESFGAEVNVVAETLYLWKREHPEFMQAHKLGKLKCQRALGKMFRGQATGQLKGSAAALIFFAKNTSGMRDDPVNEDEGYEEMEFND